ncbi:MAG: response regulator [Gammaproteobacteria bacterium]|nr:response regulator [Gammaproteobacteria bacterium]
MSKNVFIIDDSRVSRMMIRTILSKSHPNWSFTEACDGEDALSKAQGKEIDLMIIDYNMPGQDGLSLASELKTRHPTACISMLTANIQEKIRERADALGVGFVTKPITEAKVNRIASSMES